MNRYVRLSPGGPRVLRLGLSTRGNTHLSSSDVRLAMDRGVNYLNWCGYEDGLSRAVARLSREKREKVVVACQFSARSAVAAASELAEVLQTLDTDYLDIPTFYYVESEPEWEEICSPGGSLETLTRAKEEGRIRMVGLISHQRHLAARWAGSGLLDLLMIRYNAAHRGAEEDVFPGYPATGYSGGGLHLPALASSARAPAGRQRRSGAPRNGVVSICSG